ncbi:MAG: SNF2-related protein [Acidimicrobiaceae bacterium]|nr:SNF2-related protein [Acidimicrobiaceae bacterium]
MVEQWSPASRHGVEHGQSSALPTGGCETLTPGGLRLLALKPSYSSGSDDLLADFYVPALSRAVSYDRIAGYFSSSAFAGAAAGLARFVNGGGTMRLIVGAQLSADDCEALRGCKNLDDVLADRLAAGLADIDDLERRRLEVVSWLARRRRLEMRVGVPCGIDDEPLAADHPDNDGRYFHVKSGVMRDACGGIAAFSGSINESAQGWRRNYEQFNVYMSWKPEAWADYGEPLKQRFERLWNGETEPGWRIVALPEAFERQLLNFVDDDYAPPAHDPAETPGTLPPEPPEPETLSETDRKLVEEIRAAPASGSGVGLVSAAVAPWPHQLNIARRIVDTWPRSYLLADQVGLGKTIEIGLVLRELLLSGLIERALILAPASVLIQWHQELHEKFCLDAARLDGADVVFNDPPRRRPTGAASDPWSSEPLLLASSQLARMRNRRELLLNASDWDLVVMDEAHHARRSGAKASSAPNEMLALLQALKRHGKFKILLLASATPMQMHPHELWDLLSLLGLPPLWDRGAEAMQRYYEQLSEPFAARDWDLLARLAESQLSASGAPSDARAAASLAQAGPAARHRIKNFPKHGLLRPAAIPEPERAAWDEWLRAATPVRDRVFRSTRATLHAYQRDGLLPAGTVIPQRRITDWFEDLGEAQKLYARIDSYIRTRYQASASTGGAQGRALGFIMTVYRRRLTSSLRAIHCSLQRRLDALENRSALAQLFDDDDRHAVESAAVTPLPGFDDPGSDHHSILGADPFGSADEHAQRLGVDDRVAETSALEEFIDDLADLPPDDPKMRRLSSLLSECFEDGHRNVVIFTQYADTLRYIRERLLHTYRNGLACYYGGRGEIYDNASRRWVETTKEHVKAEFRSGGVQILVGTDSMSEGLNLQTCAVLVNFDLPWNFVRVEQRIGRLDRIGGKPLVHVHNLYYSNTVEVDVFHRLQERFGSFEAMLGRCSPVLSTVEGAVLDAAMGAISAEQASMQISSSVDAASEAAISVDDLEAVPEPSGKFEPAMTLEGLRERLLAVPAAARLLKPDPQRCGVWLLDLDTGFGGADAAPAPVPVAFDRSVCEAHDDVTLLTWGSGLLETLLDRVAPVSRRR